MESVKSAKRRLRQYPIILAKCGVEATAYASCVLGKDSVTLNACDKEFKSFKNCLEVAAKNLKTRL